MRYIGFLRWWLFAALMGVAGYFAYDLGAIQNVWDNDTSKLSFVILAVFVFHSLWCGIKTFSLCRQLKYGVMTSKIKELNRFQEIGWFASDACLSIGMVGTVLGFIMMLGGFATADMGAMESMKQMLSSMSLGMSTALYTTLVGLIASQLLKIQYFNLTHCLVKAQDDLPDQCGKAVDMEAEAARQKKLAVAKSKMEKAQKELAELEKETVNA